MKFEPSCNVLAAIRFVRLAARAEEGEVFNDPLSPSARKWSHVSISIPINNPSSSKSRLTIEHHRHYQRHHTDLSSPRFEKLHPDAAPPSPVVCSGIFFVVDWRGFESKSQDEMRVKGMTMHQCGAMNSTIRWFGPIEESCQPKSPIRHREIPSGQFFNPGCSANG